MKKLILILYFLSVFTKIFAQQIETIPIYELKNNEKIIFANEHGLHFYEGKNSSLIFIERIVNNKTENIAIFNGKEIGSYDNIFEPEQFWFSQYGYFYFVAQRGEKLFVNINGKEFGPYDEIDPKGNCCYHLIMTNSGKYAYSFREGNDWKLNINGKIIDVGEPTDYRFNLFEINLTDNGDYSYVYVKGEQKNIVINSVEIEDVRQYETFGWGSNTNIVMEITTPTGYYIYGNNKMYGPYDNTGYRANNLKGNFIFVVIKDGKKYVNINGNLIGPYEEIGGYYGVKMEENGDYWYAYLKDNQWILVINGKEYGAYSDYNLPVYFNNGKIIYEYIDNNKQFIKFETTIYGPYDKETLNTNTYDITFFNNNQFYFVFKKNNFYYLNINGKEIGGYDEILNPNIKSENNYAFYFRKDKDYFINVNNKTYGPYTIIDKWSKIVLTDDGKFYAKVQIIDQMVFINNGKQERKHKELYIYTNKETDRYFLYYTINNKRIININNKEIGFEGFIEQYFWAKPDFLAITTTNYTSSPKTITYNTIFPASTVCVSNNQENYLMGNTEMVFINGTEVSGNKGGFAFQFDELNKEYKWICVDKNKIVCIKYKITK